MADNLFTTITDYLFGYAYPVSFIGAMFYGIASIVYTNPSTVITNGNVAVAFNVIIGVCGVVSLFNWFNSTPVPIVGPIILPNGQQVIKIQN